MAGGCEAQSRALCRAGEMRSGTGVSRERDASVWKQWLLFEKEENGGKMYSGFCLKH